MTIQLLTEQEISSQEAKLSQLNINQDIYYKKPKEATNEKYESVNKVADVNKDDANGDKTREEFKCSAVHTLERNMPDYDYSNLVIELREKILQECLRKPGMYGQKDINKCKLDDWHLSRFLLRNKLNVDESFEMLRKAMRFNHENLCHSLGAGDFPAEFYQIGSLFGYEPDRKGNLMLYVRVKIQRKVPEIAAIFQAFLYYNIQRLDEEAKGRGISIVFDCSGAGLGNVDMDMLFMLISTLTNYFPKGLSYLLVHELPWMLKPLWHIAKAWVGEDHRQLIKFSNSRTIYEYIDRENLPDFMGGTCKRDYRTMPTNCTTLDEAAKLWGVGRDVVKRILLKFADYLPPETMEKFLADDEEFNKIIK